MRKRLPITLAAGGRWPDSGGGFGVPFNWLKIDNRGSGAVDGALSANPQAGDKVDTLFTVAAGKVRVLNLAGPRGSGDDTEEEWPSELRLVSTAGTNLVVEIADCPIVDMVFTT